MKYLNNEQVYALWAEAINLAKADGLQIISIPQLKHYIGQIDKNVILEIAKIPKKSVHVKKGKNPPTRKYASREEQLKVQYIRAKATKIKQKHEQYKNLTLEQIIAHEDFSLYNTQGNLIEGQEERHREAARIGMEKLMAKRRLNNSTES